MKVMLVKNNFSDSSVFIDMFRSLFKSLRVEEVKNYLALFYNYDNDEDILNILNAYETELLEGIHAYLSIDLPDARIKKEIELVLPLFDELPLGIYTFKEVLLKTKQISNKKEILSYILEGTGVNENFIKEFAENDLNVSQASKSMFIHRNTLIYKLNKVKSTSGFDLSCFIDAYILYSLVELK